MYMPGNLHLPRAPLPHARRLYAIAGQVTAAGAGADANLDEPVTR